MVEAYPARRSEGWSLRWWPPHHTTRPGVDSVTLITSHL